MSKKTTRKPKAKKAAPPPQPTAFGAALLGFVDAVGRMAAELKSTAPSGLHDELEAVVEAAEDIRQIANEVPGARAEAEAAHGR